MEIFLPTLESKMMAIVVAFRIVVFAIMVAGLIGYASTGRAQGAGLFGPLFRAIIIVTAIAFQDAWFPQVENTFLSVSEYIDPGYNANPTSSADAIRESTTTNPQGQSWSWRRLNQSIYQAVTNALAECLHLHRHAHHGTDADPPICVALAALHADTVCAGNVYGAGV